MFRPKIGEGEELETREYHFSRMTNKLSMLSKPYIVKVGTIRKRKANKVQLVDLGVYNKSKLGGILDWVAKLKETDIVHNEKGAYSK